MLSTVIRISWPVLGAYLLNTLLVMVDMALVGRLINTEAQASMSLCRNLIFLITSVMMGLNAGTTAYVARNFGARDAHNLRKYALHSLTIAVIVSLSITIIGAVVGKNILTLLHAEQTVADYGWSYLVIIIAGLVPMMMNLSVTALFNAMGMTAIPMLLLAGANVVNFFGDYFLIKLMGIAGAAVSTVVVSTMVTVIGIIILVRLGVLAFVPSIISSVKVVIPNIVRLGIPTSVQVLLRAFSTTLLYVIIGYLASRTVGTAALGVGILSEALAFMPGLALMTAATTLVGHALGGKNPERAKRSAYNALFIGLGIMTAMAVFFLAVPQLFVHIFTKDPEVVKQAVYYLRINAISEPFLAIAMVLSGALRGAGDTSFPLYASAFSLWVIRLPASYIFAVVAGWGLVAIWWAMSISVIIEGLLIYQRFRSGRWQKIALR